MVVSSIPERATRVCFCLAPLEIVASGNKLVTVCNVLFVRELAASSQNKTQRVELTPGGCVK
jgi:hypothetical protein